MNKMQISIPYGDRELIFAIPRKNMGEIISPRKVDSVKNVNEEINRALDNPVGSGKIEDLVSKDTKVLLIADDLTRKTPVARIIPVLIQRFIKKGIKKENIKILIALGTHRPMTEEEINMRFGQDITSRFKIINHSLDTADLLDFGFTKNGTFIQVNKLVKWADFILGIGAIIPHHLCGFSGGAKIIQPGICGADTTAQTHLLGVRWSRSLLGEVENVVREEMEEIALKAGMRHIFNVVLNTEGGIVKAFFGDYKMAFREGVKTAKNVYGVNFNFRVPVVIAGSYPCNIDFWQAHKALYSADMVCEEKGSIVVVTPCPEGISPVHQEITTYAFLPAREIEQKIDKKELTDYVGAALALAWAKVREHKRILIVSEGIDKKKADKLGFIYHKNVEDALKDCLNYHGEDAKISVLTHAPETIPYLQKNNRHA